MTTPKKKATRKDTESAKQAEEGKKMAAAEGEVVVNPTPAVTEKPVVNNEPSDMPRTLEELKKLNQSEYLVTPAAHRYLRENKWDNMHLSQFAHELRETVIRSRMFGLGRQLNLEETKAAVVFLREKRQKNLVAQEEHDRQRKEAMNLRPDDSSPNKDKEVCGVKVAKTCLVNFQPTRRYALNGVTRTVQNDQEVELGNYGVFRVDAQGNISPNSGELVPVAVCKECTRELGGTYSTWDGAKVKIEAVKAEIEADKARTMAERERVKKADDIRRSLVTPAGPRIYGGRSASEDINRTAGYLQNRRDKGDFRGSRHHR